jgi:Uncharacterised nucleotidyltransferase
MPQPVATAFPEPSVERADAALWERVGRLVDRAQSAAGVRAHRLVAFAAWRARALGEGVGVAGEARDAEIVALMAPLLLGHVRAACDAELVLLKGPEVSARYPHAAARPYGDLDLLVRDAAAVQRSLLDAGFVVVGDERTYRDIHHLRPVHLEGFPLVVEVHAEPKWPAVSAPPGFDELLAASVESVVPVAGIRALPAAHHAVLIAAHGWAHRPLGRLASLVDVAAMLEEADRDEAAAIADGWGLGRVWRTTVRAIDTLLGDASRPVALRLWARHLEQVREQTVLENHLSRWLSGWSALPPHRAAASTLVRIASDLRPAPGEGWRRKLARSRRAVANASTSTSEHEAAIGLKHPPDEEER